MKSWSQGGTPLLGDNGQHGVTGGCRVLTDYSATDTINTYKRERRRECHFTLPGKEFIIPPSSLRSALDALGRFLV